MVSHSPGRLLPTIRSRCRRLALKPLSDAVVQDLLDKGQPGLPAADKTALTGLAEGSIGRALDLAEQGGLDLYREMIGLLSAAPRLDIPALHAFADKMARPESDGAWRTLTELLCWWLARLVRAGGTGGAGLSEVVAGESALMTRLLAAAGLERWLEVWEKLRTLFARVDAVNLDRKQALLTAFLTVERLAQGK